MADIKFGTDGWRGIIGESFTFENARTVAQAAADYWREKGTAERGIVVGYDARLLSSRCAEELARVLAANGVRVFLTAKMVATPVLSFAVRNLRAAGGLMVTASHNPADYNGIKFKGEYGGSALPETTRRIEELLGKNPVRRAEGFTPLIVRFNPDAEYLEHLRRMVNGEAIREAGLRVVVDPMHGSGRGYLKAFLQPLGVAVQEIRAFDNPGFGGAGPEPVPPNTRPLQQAVLRWRADVGLALDGDADRLGAVDAKGNFVNPHCVYALLLRHLVEKRRWLGPAAKTFSTTVMVDRLGNRYSLPVYETPIGFKYICALFLKEDLLIGGEESGGISIRSHIPERDGILAALLLLEAMAAARSPLHRLVESLRAEVGAYYYDRMDLPFSYSSRDFLMDALQENPPQHLGPYAVAGCKVLDGVKLLLEEDSWLLFRPSGTEPRLRIYVEARGEKEVRQLLEEAQRLYYRLKARGRNF